MLSGLVYIILVASSDIAFSPATKIPLASSAMHVVSPSHMDEINTALIQTRIPPATLSAAMNAATLDGISVAAWLRRLIAKELGISHRTVEQHRSHIFDKLGVTSVVELIHALPGRSR